MGFPYAPAALGNGLTDWLNVKEFGARGDGIADDTGAIQAACNAAPAGSVIYFPAGKFLTTAQVTVPTGLLLRGNQSFRSAARSQSWVRPAGTFTGASVFAFAAGTPSAAIMDLTLDGVNLAGGNTVDGIDILGAAKQWSLTGLVIRNFGQYGINIAIVGGGNPDGGYIDACSVTGNGSDGIHWAYCVDSICRSVHCDSNGGAGIFMANINNTSFTACKSQQNAGAGYELTAGFAKPNGTFVGCFSENNGTHGFYMHSFGNAGSVTFTGCNTRDEGLNGASGSGFAGFSLSASGIDLILTGCSNFLTSSAAGPDYGLVLTGCTGSVSVNSSSLLGSVAPYLDGGGNTHLYIDQSVSLATGQSDTKVISSNFLAALNAASLTVKEGVNAKMGTAVLNGTTAVVVSTTAVTANSRIFLTIESPGGTPASAYVSARTAGTSFSVKSTGASDTSTVAWLIVEPG